MPQKNKNEPKNIAMQNAEIRTVAKSLPLFLK